MAAPSGFTNMADLPDATSITSADRLLMLKNAGQPNQQMQKLSGGASGLNAISVRDDGTVQGVATSLDFGAGLSATITNGIALIEAESGSGGGGGGGGGGGLSFTLPYALPDNGGTPPVVTTASIFSANNFNKTNTIGFIFPSASIGTINGANYNNALRRFVKGDQVLLIRDSVVVFIATLADITITSTAIYWNLYHKFQIASAANALDEGDQLTIVLMQNGALQERLIGRLNYSTNTDTSVFPNANTIRFNASDMRNVTQLYWHLPLGGGDSGTVFASAIGNNRLNTLGLDTPSGMIIEFSAQDSYNAGSRTYFRLVNRISASGEYSRWNVQYLGGTDQSSGSLGVSDGSRLDVRILLTAHEVFAIRNAGLGLTTRSSGAPINSIDSYANPSTKILLTDSRSISAITNAMPGVIIRLILEQGGSGSNTITWGSNFKWAGGAPPTLSTAIGSRDVLIFLVESASIYLCIGQTLNIT